MAIKFLKIASAVTMIVLSSSGNASLLSYASNTCSGPSSSGIGTGCTSVIAQYGFNIPLPVVGDSISVTGSDINSFSLNWIDGEGVSHPASSVVFNNNGSWSIQNDAILGLTGSGFLNAGVSFDVGTFSMFSQISGPGTSAINDFAASLDIGPVTSIGTWTVVPVPAAAWLFGSGLLGLIGIARKKVAF